MARTWKYGRLTIHRGVTDGAVTHLECERWGVVDDGDYAAEERSNFGAEIRHLPADVRQKLADAWDALKAHMEAEASGVLAREPDSA